MKYRGCAYYPEYWGLERLDTDARLMVDAGINIVRIGEFAWARLEPEEGVYTFDWLHLCIEKLSSYGIDVVMCTPTAAPPAWLTYRYPDTTILKADGSRLEHGNRRHYCYCSNTYRKFTSMIVEKLSVEISRHKNVVAWQVDNEPDIGETDICLCEECQTQFQTWLKNRYGSLTELNERWRTGFWSMDYSDWRQLRLGPLDAPMYSSRKLDIYRFASDMLSDFVLMQAAIIKANHPSAAVSTNLNGSVFTGLDYYKIFSNMDIPFKDLYFDICTQDVNAMIMNQFRSFKPGVKYWVTETGAGAIDMGRPAKSGQFRAWFWSNYAHGADAHIVFRWRTCLSGQEQELQGILEHSGYPGHRYRAIKEAFCEMRDLVNIFGDLPLPQVDVAIIHDYQVMWGYQSSVVKSEINYEKNFSALHREFYKRNILVDIISPKASMLGYKLVVLPSMMIIDDDLAERLKDYVRNGGVVFAQGHLGMRDLNDNYITEAGPNYLQELFGVRIVGGMYLFSQTAPDEFLGSHHDFNVRVAGNLGKMKVEGQASIWLADMQLAGGTTLLEVAEDTYAGQPAVVECVYEKGFSYYACASTLDNTLTGNLIEYILNKASIHFYADIPVYVEIVKRGDFYIIVNHRDEDVYLNLNIDGKCMLSYWENGTIHLNPFGVCVMTK